MQKILIIGFGNPGRVDDGIGPACIKRLEQLDLDRNQITLDSDYQLTLETSQDIANHQEIIFIDASVVGDKAFLFEPIPTGINESFSTHDISPSALMQLTNCLYKKTPKASMLAIRGYEFNQFGEYLSDKAQINLNAGINFLKNYIMQNTRRDQATQEMILK